MDQYLTNLHFPSLLVNRPLVLAYKLKNSEKVTAYEESVQYNIILALTIEVTTATMQCLHPVKKSKWLDFFIESNLALYCSIPR